MERLVAVRVDVLKTPESDPERPIWRRRSLRPTIAYGRELGYTFDHPEAGGAPCPTCHPPAD